MLKINKKSLYYYDIFKCRIIIIFKDQDGSKRISALRFHAFYLIVIKLQSFNHKL